MARKKQIEIIASTDRMKYVLSRDLPHKSLIVAPEIHKAVATFAKKNKLTMVQATYYLISKALLDELGETEDLEVSPPV